MVTLDYRDNTWYTVAPIKVNVRNFEFTVPANFETDLASIPRVFWSIYPPFGKYIRAAIVHDYLYRETSIPENTCDFFFYELMKADGVDLFTRFVFYLFVRGFGSRDVL